MIKKLIIPTILGFTSGLIIIYLPPVNIFIIIGVILLLSVTVYLFISAFINKKTGLLTGLVVCLFLLINYFVGFGLLNMIILISLLITLQLLIK